MNSSPNIPQALPGGYLLYFTCNYIGQWVFQVISDTGVPQITPTVGTTGSTLNPLLSLSSIYQFSALSGNLVANPPAWFYRSGQRLLVMIKDDGTSRTITWGGSYIGICAPMPGNTIAGKQMYFDFCYNEVTQKWEMINFAFEQGAKQPIKVYKALLSQTGTAAPTATVLANSFGITPSYSYVGTGNYTLTATGILTTGKMFARIQGALTGGFWASCNTLSSPDTLQIQTFNNIGGGTNAQLNNTPIEIQIFQ